MASDLYGKKKPAKIKGKEISSSNSASFSSSLASLITNSVSGKKATSTKNNLKADKEKPDIFTAHKQSKKRKLHTDDNGQAHQTEQDLGGISRAELDRSKRRMEEKVRLYNAMKRGEYVSRKDGRDEQGLVDFDRKWADKQYSNDDSDLTDTSDNSDAECKDTELIEYFDDLGRLRKGTKKDAERQARKAKIESIARQEALEFQARPQMPSSVIYGDAIQHQAYDPDRLIKEKMAELAKKRDKSATPPPDTHFDASAEVRTKGTGFYTFSHDTEQRQKEMDALEESRRETERVRAENLGNKVSSVNEVPDAAKNESQDFAPTDADRFLDSLNVELG